MINAEKYKNEILAVTNKHKYFALKADNPTAIIECNDVEQCRGCLFDNGACSSSKMKWLLSEYKETIKLTRLEYEILKYLSKIHTHIARDSDDSLHAYRIAPIKEPSSWELSLEEIHLDGYCDVYEDLFKFIKWEDKEPRVIKDILNNCIVK